MGLGAFEVDSFNKRGQNYTTKDLYQMIMRTLLCCCVALFNSLISLAKKPFAALGVASCSTNGERIRAQRTFFAKIDLVSVILIYVWGFDPFLLLKILGTFHFV